MREQSIDVPESVIRRFFSKEKVLTEFLQKGTRTVYNQLIEDVGKTYKITDESVSHLTELAYVLYERLKSNDHDKSLPSLSLLLCESLNSGSNTELVLNLVECLTKFDASLLSKLLLHALKPKRNIPWAQRLS